MINWYNNHFHWHINGAVKKSGEYFLFDYVIYIDFINFKSCFVLCMSITSQFSLFEMYLFSINHY
jgi:hypothetical protein